MMCSPPPIQGQAMTWVQFEALTGLPAQNDGDMHHNGYTNSPFIKVIYIIGKDCYSSSRTILTFCTFSKTNYPHPTGVWSWGTEADNVALTVQYIRRS